MFSEGVCVVVREFMQAVLIVMTSVLFHGSWC